MAGPLLNGSGMKHLISLAAVAWMSSGTFAAAEPRRDFGLVAETAHFRHFVQGGSQGGVRRVSARAGSTAGSTAAFANLSPVGGAKRSAQRREEALERYERLLGAHVDKRLDWFTFERPEDIAAVTGQYLSGYFESSSGRILATPEAEEHEIVHAVAHELGDPGSFFHEGLAVVLGNRSRLGPYSADRESKRLLKSFSPEALVKGKARLEEWEKSLVAASFMKWLIGHEGLPAVVAFFRASGRTGSPVAFATSFDLPLEQAAREWGQHLGAEAPVQLVRISEMAR